MPEKKINLDKELREHSKNPHVRNHKHPPTKLSLKKQDSILWFSTMYEDFEIVSVHKDFFAPKRKQKKNAPDNPFYRNFGARPHEDGKCVSSGPVRPDAVGQQYKAVYRIGTVTIDPHIFIGR